MDLKKTGELIASERKAAGLTQAELAEKISVSSKAVSRWETGMVYYQILIMPAPGVIFVRYFLSEKKN